MNKKIPAWRRNIMKINMPNFESVDTMNPKERFRVICEENIPYIRNIDLPSITQNNKYEAVLIEYRCFPHLEFLIRNAIIKLGDKWTHTVVCGNLNHDFMVSMCANISPEIKIIKSEYDNLNQSTYSLYLATKEFWELFSGEKILLYQEDSCIFKNNIDDFLQWDYIGAPWNKTHKDTPNCVGNGGFSLRTRQCMIDVIDKVSIQNTNMNSSTIKYIKNTGMTVCPEDVYFSKNMQDYEIGKVADWNSAFAFSSETVYNGDSFGGHNFWLSDEKWKLRIVLAELNLIDKIIENKKIFTKKTLVLFACHTNSEMKLNTMINNFSYFDKHAHMDFVIVNSTGLDYANTLEKILGDKCIAYYSIDNMISADFGKWIFALNEINYNAYYNIIFTNDSYIIKNPIDLFVYKSFETTTELYGYNDSAQRNHHYQSYLFSIKSDYIHKFIAMYENKINHITCFEDVINMYELQMLNYFNNHDCLLKIGHLSGHKLLNIFFTSDNLYLYLYKNRLLPFIKIKRITQQDEYVLPEYFKFICQKHVLFNTWNI
jgi:hypothetical protein